MLHEPWEHGQKLNQSLTRRKPRRLPSVLDREKNMQQFTEICQCVGIEWFVLAGLTREGRIANAVHHPSEIRLDEPRIPQHFMSNLLKLININIYVYIYNICIYIYEQVDLNL